MKNKLKTVALTIIRIFIIICGFYPLFLGMMYFMIINPTENWITIFKNIPPENIWILSISFFISGIFTMVIPIAHPIHKLFEWKNIEPTRTKK